jgi:hypothetical protein
VIDRSWCFALGVGRRADPRHDGRFDLADDRVGGAHEHETAVGGHDQRRPPIHRIGSAGDVAESLEVIEDGPDGLRAPTGLSRQLTRPDADLVQLGEHGAVPRADVVNAEFARSVKQLPLHGEEQSCGRHPKVGATSISPALSSHLRCAEREDHAGVRCCL